MTLVSDVKAGDKLILDVGYGLPQDEICEVLKVLSSSSLFEDEDTICFVVRIVSSKEEFTTHNFYLTNKVETA